VNTYIVDWDTAVAIWNNARWFSPHYYKRTPLDNGKYKVKTNYDASLFIQQ
jgi:hypothetical protein